MPVSRNKSPISTMNLSKSKQTTPQGFVLQHEIFHKVEKQAKDLQDMMHGNMDDGLAPTRQILHELENLGKVQHDELKNCWDKRYNKIFEYKIGAHERKRDDDFKQ